MDNSLLSFDKYSIMIGVRDPEMAIPVQESLHPLESTVVIGKNYPSFSKLVNDCIMQAKEEIVIFCSHRVRPKPTEITKMVNLLKQGYGLVGLYRFGFFGFTKELIRRVGFMDERFVGGNYEDCDMETRLLEANIAYYEEESTEYHGGWSTWGDENATRPIFYSKWSFEGKTIIRKVHELTYNYDIGKPIEKSTASLFLPWSKSYILPCAYAAEIFDRHAICKILN